jgi:broad specificity phosphatase PhoE
VTLEIQGGGRERADGISAVFCSDLARAVETAAIAFGGTGTPVLMDWRLRECDYGSMKLADGKHFAVSGSRTSPADGEQSGSLSSGSSR